MHLDIFNTHIELYPYTKDDYPAIENMYTSVDKFSQKEVPCGYMIEDGKLFLPRGTPISKIESMTRAISNYRTDIDPIQKMSKQFSSLYDPRNKLQEDSIKFLKSGDHQLGLNLSPGAGKAEPISRKIPTPTSNGWTRMGDLKVGDYVFGRDGMPTKILKIFDQGIKDIYKITFNDGRYALCTDQHLWWVKTYKNGRYKTFTTQDLYRDYLNEVSNYQPSLNKPECFFTRYIPICGRVAYPEQDVPIDPWILGVFIGNGCLREQPLTISSYDSEIPERIANHYNWTFKRSCIKNYSYVFYDMSGNRIKTKDFFKDIPDIVNNYSDEKVIPDIYLYNHPECRCRLLQGLMDTDGSISYTEGRYHVSYSSCSKTLLIQIQQILFSFGLSGNIIVDKRTHKYRNKYCGSLIFNVPNWVKSQFFTIFRKSELANQASHQFQKNYYDDIRIRKIQIVKQEESRCIMVDSEDHLYLTEDFIVTHNTFCVAFASTQLNEKIIVITPNEGLKQQWISTYSKMFNYRPKNIMNIAGSNIIESFMDDLIEPADVYFVNHQTLRSYMTTYNGYTLHKFFKKLNVGIKVYDEAHMEFANILLLDSFTNTNRTWYLTATFDRSDKTESACFKRAFNSVITFGEMESKQIAKKHVVYHVVNINSRITPKNRAKVISYSGMSSASYGRYAFFDDENHTVYQAILMILEKVKDLEGKTLIFVPLIDAVDDVVKKLKKDFPNKSVGAFHSKVSKDEKESTLKKDIIVSTIKSCGTGKDIPGLRCLICAEPIASKVIAEQMFGRLRPYGEDKLTYFFDIVDRCIMPINWWFNARFKKIETLAKEIVYLNLDK